MTVTQSDKATRFTALHQGPSVFVIPNSEEAGVKRISLATSLYHAAVSSLLEAAREVKEKGAFGYLDRSLPASELNGFMRG